MKLRPAPRALTTLAVGFLLLDAALFALAAFAGGRPVLLIPAGVCAAATVLVIYAWRRYRRTLAELADARREMKREVESLRALLDAHLRN
ncbi:MAG: hypothetical protein ACREME_06865 [Gemmatimonadales bacterium]